MNRVLMVLLLLISGNIYGQKRTIPVSVSLFNESTAIPFTRFVTRPIRPGIQLGTELNYKNTTGKRLYQTVNLSYFYHRYLTQAIGIHSELGYERRFRSGIALAGLFGLGYMHTFATADEYTFDNGQYQKKPDKGNARLYPSLSFDLGYYINKKNENSAKIFLRYQAWAEYPYSPDFIPVMTHINLHLGCRFNLIR